MSSFYWSWNLTSLIIRQQNVTIIFNISLSLSLSLILTIGLSVFKTCLNVFYLILLFYVLAGWFPQTTVDDTKYLQHVLLLKSFRFTRLLAWYNNFIQQEGYNLSVIQIAGRRVTWGVGWRCGCGL